MDTGKRIKKVRGILRLHQRDFGQRIGVTTSTVSGWESGRRSPSQAIIKSICKTYNVNYLWLTEGCGDMFDKTPIIWGSISDRISELRYTLGFSQRDFGKKIGIGGTAVSKLENGERNPSKQTLKFICREYNVNHEWLVNGIGEMFVSDSLIENLILKYDLSDTGANLIKKYLLLTKSEQEVIEKYLRNVFTSD